jgi:hypothetical protein
MAVRVQTGGNGLREASDENSQRSAWISNIMCSSNMKISETEMEPTGINEAESGKKA